MASARSPRRPLGLGVAVLIALAFVSPGAWLIVALPPIPIAKALQLATVGLWLLAGGFLAARFSAPDRRLLWAAGAVGLAVALSYAAGGSWPQVALYGLFTNMSLLQWVSFPVVFLLAAGIAADRRSVEAGLAAVAALGALLAAVLAYQQITTNANWVFGTTAYSITALAPVIPIAAGVAAGRRGWARASLYVAAALTAIALAFFSGSMMGALAAGFGVTVAVAVQLLVRPTRVGRMLGAAAAVIAALMVAVLLVAEVPAVGGGLLASITRVRQDRNVMTRVYLWQGAQKLFLARPLLGTGPSGYRVAAVEYLPPEALQFGADVPGNVDPTVYSPQSPHALVWEIATQLGIVGLAAFAALLAAWAAVLAARLRAAPDERMLRATLAAGFLTALFALMVNPVAFAIGLFAPVTAGLAAAPVRRDGSRRKPEPRADAARPRAALVVAGGLVVVLALWLGIGEWKSYTAGADDAVQSIPQYEAALRLVPGEPMASRRLLEARLLAATSIVEEQAAQRAVDDAPGYMRAYAPDLVDFAAMSMAQAERTGRRDLRWENAVLVQAARRMPPIPSLVAERLHLAVLTGDVAAIHSAIRDAERWGAPYPYTATYLEQAKKFLASVQ